MGASLGPMLLRMPPRSPCLLHLHWCLLGAVDRVPCPCRVLPNCVASKENDSMVGYQ